MNDSDNTTPPFFGPELPTYPELPQIVRVTGGPLGGANVYSAFVQQWTPPLSLRDRESCYVFEPNGIRLGPGFYDSRLDGSYLGLPLFVTTCCPSGNGSSSSSSSS